MFCVSLMSALDMQEISQYLFIPPILAPDAHWHKKGGYICDVWVRGREAMVNLTRTRKAKVAGVFQSDRGMESNTQSWSSSCKESFAHKARWKKGIVIPVGCPKV